MENQPAVVFPSNRRDIKSIQIKHLGMALVGFEARRLRFATPGYFANRRKAESWRISSLSFLSFWVVCACMFGLDICLCVCLNWPANGACITSIHLPQNQGKLLDQSEQRQSLSVPGQGVQAGSPRGLSPSCDAPHLSRPNRLWRDIDILSAISYSMHWGYPHFTSRGPHENGHPPNPGTIMLHKDGPQPPCQLGLWRCAVAHAAATRSGPDAHSCSEETGEWLGSGRLQGCHARSIAEVPGVPQKTSPNKLGHLMSSGFFPKKMP